MERSVMPYAARRTALMAGLEDGVAIVRSPTVAYRCRDIPYPYRPDSDVLYLTGFEEPGAVCVLAPGHAEHPFVLFVPPCDPEREQWDGARAGVEGAVARYGADAAFPLDELDERLPALLDGAPAVYYQMGYDETFDRTLIQCLTDLRRSERTGLRAPDRLIDIGTLLDPMRLVKGPEEIAVMRRAARITTEAHRAAMRVVAPGTFEHAVQAALTHTFLRHGAPRHAFAPIVGSGPNATVLHYEANDRRMEDGDLVVIDAGAEYRYYVADVTRTVPVNGRFSAPQRAVYEVVLRAQQAAIERVRPGVSLQAVHERAVEVIAEGLLDLGLLTGSAEAIIAEETYRRFFMHRTSHWIGLDIRDRGRYGTGDDAQTLAPGMVLTVEPGLYIASETADVDPRYWNIGVRIEDDVLVTDADPEVLTADAPKDADAIEAWMAGREWPVGRGQ